MSTVGPGPSFEAPPVGALGRAVLKGGMATVRLEGDALKLTGDEGGELAIPAHQVDRIRIVHFGGGRRPTSYETRIWRGNGEEPLLIMPPPHHPGDYATVIRSFAARVAALRGLDRVLRGPGRATAIVQLLLVGLPVTLLAAFLLFAAVADGSGWMWLLATLALALDAWLIAGMVRNRWPRRVRTLDELDRELPPGGRMAA